MKEMKYKILNKEYSNLENTIGYTLGMSIFSLSSMFLLMFITRLTGSYVAGIFSIGWAVGQQMITVGLFGTRNIQVSDIKNTFQFGHFLSFRIFSVVLMILSSVVYIHILGLSDEQKIASILLTLLMTGESFADVFAGYFQRTNRLAISGISYAMRIILYDILCILVLFFTHSLIISISAAIIFSYLWLIIVDLNLVLVEEKNIFNWNKNKQKKLLILSFSIFVSAFLTNYIVNVPKNSIAILLDNSTQTYYNILSTPSFVISLIGAVFITPMYTKIAKLAQSNKKDFVKYIIKIILFILFITVAFIVLGVWIGLPLLNIIFGVNLVDYKLEFCILLISGGLSSLSTFFVYLLTVLEISNILYPVYIGVSIFITFISNLLIRKFYLLGASLTYFISTFIISFVLMIIILIVMKKENRKNGE